MRDARCSAQLCDYVDDDAVCPVVAKAPLCHRQCTFALEFAAVCPSKWFTLLQAASRAFWPTPSTPPSPPTFVANQWPVGYTARHTSRDFNALGSSARLQMEEMRRMVCVREIVAQWSVGVRGALHSSQNTNLGSSVSGFQAFLDAGNPANTRMQHVHTC
jgi:hypothetical protein